MKRYSVVVLGARGAGKTVFLASMFSQLSTAGALGFRLETSLSKQIMLNRIFNEVATGTKWPQANQLENVDEWEFDVRVTSNAGRSYTAFQITYIDYSGGRLTDLLDDPSFQKRIDDADCLIGLLDGQKVYDFMNGVDPDGMFKFVELPSICSLLQKNSNPTHFILSKWDLFDNVFHLEDVRRKLIEDHHFRDVVCTLNRQGVTVRLIPVSSVGTGFAIREQNGAMRKVQGKVPEPFQVEVPFACVLLDKLRAELTRISRERERFETTKVDVTPNLTLWDRIKRGFGGVVRLVKEYLPERYHFSEKLLQKIAESAERAALMKEKIAHQTAAEKAKDVKESLARVYDEASALEHAVDRFIHIQTELEHHFPSSNIKLPDCI